jgi:hypothetical protein
MHIHANIKGKQECADKASYHDQCANAFATRKTAFCATMRVTRLGCVNGVHTDRSWIETIFNVHLYDRRIGEVLMNQLNLIQCPGMIRNVRQFDDIPS